LKVLKPLEKPARILVIDDENIRKVLKAILEDEGYIVETVETAKKGIEKRVNKQSTTSR
jgi:DNA-binding NtrC family response regulator